MSRRKMAFNMGFLYDLLMSFPSKIICLTEETVETLYLLGKGSLIQGVSQYAMRPPEARALPQVSQFIRSDIDQIAAMKPDLVLGFSDLQKDIAAQLIGRGINVFVTNQRSLSEILEHILLLSRMVGAGEQGEALVDSFKQKLQSAREAGSKLRKRPRVYFEEWDHPRLSCIQWVSELIEACGGENIFKDRIGPLARERQVNDEEIRDRNPDIIFGCWCGKAVKTDAICKRPGLDSVTAVKNGAVWELPPEIFLQPGPALFVDGLDMMLSFFAKTAHS